jgi:hypothetical protein
LVLLARLLLAAALMLLARLLLAAALMLLVRLVLAATLLLARLLLAALLLLARLVLPGVLIRIVGICHTGLLEGSDAAPRGNAKRRKEFDGVQMNWVRSCPDFDMKLPPQIVSAGKKIGFESKSRSVGQERIAHSHGEDRQFGD